MDPIGHMPPKLKEYYRNPCKTDMEVKLMVDYYCDSCAKKNELPKKMRKTLHKCKYCGEERICNDDKPVKSYGGKK